MIPSLLAALAIAALSALLLARVMRSSGQPLLPRSGTPLWLGGTLALAIIAFLIYVSAGHVLLFLLPALIALPLLFQRRPSAGETPPPAEVVETGWLRSYRQQRAGPMDATVTRGPLEGRRLSDLGLSNLIWLHQQIDDDDSLAMLERFLNQEFPGWRERVDKAAAELLAEGMSAEKAREILNLGPEAGPDEVVAAHQRLMQRLHPDRGGSRYLATMLNRAKEVLLEKR